MALGLSLAQLSLTVAAPAVLQNHLGFSSTWELPKHLCAGGVCQWSTCAEWKENSCPLPCAMHKTALLQPF